MKKLVFTVVAVAAGAFVVANAMGAGAATNRVTIVHVQKGCHEWSTGAARAASVRLSLPKGGSLTVLNHDLDMHKVVQVSGPKIKTGPFMMMNQRVVLRFAKAGLYRFHTSVADMRGMPEAQTIGPDNKLVLTIRVS